MSDRDLAAGHTRLRVQDDWGPVNIIVKPDGGMFVESLVGRECFAQEPAAEPRLPKRGEVWRVKQPVAYGTYDGIVAGQWVRATGFYSDDCRRVDVEVANGSRRTVWLDNLESLPPLPEE